MLEFLSLQPPSFGLDLSEFSLKFVQLEKKKKGFYIPSFGEAAIEPGIIKGEEIVKEDDLVKIIKKAIAQPIGKKLSTKNIIASLPEAKAFLQVIQMPRLPDQDLKSAVVYEAENYIPLPLEEVYIDSQIIPSKGKRLDHLDVLIAALPKKTVDSYLSAFLKAGLAPIGLEIESLAISRALVRNQTIASPVLLVDFGASRTNFIVFSGSSPRFTFSIPVSSQKFTEAIAKTMQLSLSQAEKLKLKYGLDGRARKTGQEVFEALVPALADLTDQIKKYLDYYQTHSGHEHLGIDKQGVKNILISGGGANLKGLSSFLAGKLKLPVQIANPWVNVFSSAEEQPKPKGLSFANSQRYTTALGLALRGADRSV